MLVHSRDSDKISCKLSAKSIVSVVLTVKRETHVLDFASLVLAMVPVR